MSANLNHELPGGPRREDSHAPLARREDTDSPANGRNSADHEGVCDLALSSPKNWRTSLSQTSGTVRAA